jgi:hypothetical protein
MEAPGVGGCSIDGRGAHLRRASQADQERGIGGIGPDVQVGRRGCQDVVTTDHQ